LFDVGTHRNTRSNKKLNTVFRHSGNRRRVNYFRNNRHLNGLKYIATCEVDSSCYSKRKGNVCFRCRNQRTNYALDISAGKIMRFKFIVRNFYEACFVRFYHRIYDNRWWHSPYPHQKQIHQPDINT
jgi:hypothetical protein